MTSPEHPAPVDPGKIHGHTGPTTPAEDTSRQASPDAVPPSDLSKIAEEASRQEDA